MEISYPEILKNQHFLQFAAIFNIAQSAQWRKHHVEFNVRVQLQQLAEKLQKESGWPASKRQDFILQWNTLVANIVSEDPRLQYSEEDMNWFVEILSLDNPEQAKAIFAMLFAVASTRRLWLTTAQVAKLTGEAESTWKNRAAQGKILGVHKEGKTWSFSALALRAYGVDVPANTFRIEEDE